MNYIRVSFFSTILALAGTPAAAQTPAPSAPAASSSELTEVIVTARRVEENQQTVPVAVTVVAPQVIQNYGSFNSYNLSKIVPGLAANPYFNSRDTATFTIRGQSQTFATLFPAVIPYFAEVPLKTLAQGSFYDLENIQVLRGPQGVKFGRVTDGGAVLVSPAKPTSRFGGYIQARLGNYNLHDFQGMLNVPIVDEKLMVRAAFDINRRDGFTTNLANGQDLDDVHYNSARVSVLFKPTDWIENYSVFQMLDLRGNGTGFKLYDVFPGAFPTTLFPALGPSLAQAQALPDHTTNIGNVGVPDCGPSLCLGIERVDRFASNTTTVELPFDMTLRNIFGYYFQKKREGADFDGTANVNFLGALNRRGYLDRFEHLSDEMQLRGTALDENLSWLVGFYIDKQKMPEGVGQVGESLQLGGTAATFGVLSASNLIVTTESRAFYVQGEYKLDRLIRGLAVNGGFRYTKDTVLAQNSSYSFAAPGGVAGGTLPSNFPPGGSCVTPLPAGIGGFPCLTSSATFHANTYEGGVSQHLFDNTFVYGSVRRGYRPGGANATALPSLAFYNPEYNFEYEVGLKSDWRLFGAPVRTNFALFRDELMEAQKILSIVVPPLTTGVTNVGEATIQGLEFEGTIIPVTGLDIGMNYTYSDAEYDRESFSGTDAQYGSAVNGACNRAAPSNPPSSALSFCPYNRVGLTPKHRINVAVHYTLPLSSEIGEIRIGGDYSYQSRQGINDQTAKDPSAIIKAYGIANLDVMWSNVLGRPFDLSAFVTNVGNRYYGTYGVTTAFAASLGTHARLYGEPRMWGISVKYRFGSEAD